jgi:O-acetylserine/cysteine efflux transporter
MTPRDVLAALIASVVWGLTFIATKFGVGEAPPFLLTALRFLFAAFPLVFFIKPPKTSPLPVATYGFLIGVGQFGLIFLAIKMGMPIGLVSLVVQLQVFITILLAFAFMGERPTRIQTIATGIALLGICTIGSARLSGAEFLPFLLTLGGAACWGAGNLVGKYVGRVDPFALMVWSSLVPPLPMLALSFLFERGQMFSALSHPTPLLIGCVAMLAYGGTLIAFSLWSSLLSRYPAALVTPFALLIPVVGMIAGRIVFNEPTSPIEFLGALLIMAGLSFNVLGERLLTLRRVRIQ